MDTSANFCVIMAGGIGSRFWPFSRNDRPKQFLDFFDTGHSLLQMTVDRFRSLVPIENMLIVTNVLYKDTILEQIPDLSPDQVLCEPARRNTAPCIAYAVARIKGIIRQRTGLTIEEAEWDDDRLNANIIVTPSDHLILQEMAFVETIKKGLNFTSTHDALLTLGMKPTRPETGYGYIQMASVEESTNDGIYRVKTFTEKPNKDLAQVFMDSGEFLWNSGIFLWNLRAIRHALSEHLPDLVEKFLEGEQYMGTEKENAFIQEMFPTCPNISIDYGVMEKAKCVYVLPSDFGWSDLGTWGALYDLSSKSPEGNVTLKGNAMYYDGQNNMVALPEGELVVIDGLDGYLVARDNGVLLICPKDQEAKIRQYVKDAEEKFGNKYI